MSWNRSVLDTWEAWCSENKISLERQTVVLRSTNAVALTHGMRLCLGKTFQRKGFSCALCDVLYARYLENEKDLHCITSHFSLYLFPFKSIDDVSMIDTKGSLENLPHEKENIAQDNVSRSAQ